MIALLRPYLLPMSRVKQQQNDAFKREGNALSRADPTLMS